MFRAIFGKKKTAAQARKNENEFILNVEYREKRMFVGLNVGGSTTVQEVKEMLYDRYQNEWKGKHQLSTITLLKEGHQPLPNEKSLFECGVRTDGNVNSALLLTFGDYQI